MLLRHILLALALLLPLPAFAAGVHGHSSNPWPFARLGSMLYFVTDQGGIWQTNGREPATMPFFWEGQAGPPGRAELPIGFREELFLFIDRDELWATTGVKTRLVANLRSRGVAEALATSEQIVFTDGYAVWRSDGTTAGTREIHDFGEDFEVELVGVAGPLVYFTVYGYDEDNVALWRTDGTEEGTFTLPASEGNFLRAVAFGDRLFFSDWYHVWTTDGTEEGTVVFHEIPAHMVVADGALWLSDAKGLWRSDGTREGTELVSASGADTELLADANGRLILLHHGEREIRISAWQDGAVTEPVVVRGRRYNLAYAAVGNALFFTLADDEHGHELWRSDATPDGTFLLRDVNPGTGHSGAYAPTAIAGRVVFGANDGKHGYEPWVTDGTREGTKMLVNIAPEGVLRGRVTDAETGAPIARARVALQDSTAPNGILGTTDTDDDGAYVFAWLEPAHYDIEVTSTAHLAQKQTWFQVHANPWNTASFALRPGGTLSGRVTDRSGAPVARIRVVAAPAYGEPPIATAVTSADGTYLLGGLPAGQPWLVYTISENGWSSVIYPNVSCAAGCNGTSGGTRITVEARERRDGVHFTIARWGVIRGRVADMTTGRPTGRVVRVAAFPVGVAMNAHSPPFSVYIDEKKTDFELTLPDGSYYILASWQTYNGTLPGPYNPTWYPATPCEPCTTQAGTPVSPVAGEATTIDFLLPSRYGHVAGRVLGMDGRPVAGIPMGDGWTETNADGTYLILNVRPGAYHVRTQADETWAGTVEGDPAVMVDVQKNAVVQAPDIRVHRWGTLRGQIVDGVTRIPLHTSLFVLASEWTYGKDYDGYQSTSAHGKFMVGELWPAPYELRVSMPGYAYRVVTGTSALDTDLAVRVVMEPACEVSVSPAEANVPAEGGVVELHVQAPCRVCAQTQMWDMLAWITSCVDGSGTIPVTVRPNASGSPRAATISLPGTRVDIRQD